MIIDNRSIGSIGRRSADERICVHDEKINQLITRYNELQIEVHMIDTDLKELKETLVSYKSFVGGIIFAVSGIVSAIVYLINKTH